MKLHTLSSLIKLERPKTPMPKKIVISTTTLSMNKCELRAILQNYSKVEIISINSVNIQKKKKITSQVVGKKYSKVYSLLKTVNKKKFILSFKHSADRNIFLSEIGAD